MIAARCENNRKDAMTPNEANVTQESAEAECHPNTDRHTARSALTPSIPKQQTPVTSCTPPGWPPFFDAAIFDFDGTIADTASLWREVDLAFLGARGLPLDDSYPRMLSVLGFTEGARYTIERFGLHERVEDICDEWNRMGRSLYRTRVALRPGVEFYLSALREHGVALGLATTNDPAVLESMKNIDVGALFDERVYGKEVAHAKDHPDIYLECARRLKSAPERCIVFEDIAPGIISAHSANMATCAVRSNDPLQVFEEVCSVADYAIESWIDLVKPS